ncbi:conserved exported protein of unknown function [Methanocaldococcus lauensis]|uniref:Uncharacterized protein n=1 Tax=Methanocaldococcus lauensis TaxID=2546128 RepID=A0A8D6SVT3_9EURY|nr:hypothetical protein [Methanocaldococcus lauensis]CAB3288714.1 conserved exported protein of unknown function [Methanocaldococcus lauensis]
MKKLFTIFLLFSFLFSILTLSFAWNDCPYGRVNCTYPGECGRYIDTNNNGICDHSEPPPSNVEYNENNKIEDNTNNVNIELTEEFINEYVTLSGKELRLYTIKEICDKYGINPKCLKEKLNIIDVSDDTTFDEIKNIYGIPTSVVKRAIVECMIEEGKIKLNVTQNLSINNLKTNTVNEENKNESIIDKIISFLFSTINLRDILLGWL